MRFLNEFFALLPSQLEGGGGGEAGAVRWGLVLVRAELLPRVRRPYRIIVPLNYGNGRSGRLGVQLCSVVVANCSLTLLILLHGMKNMNGSSPIFNLTKYAIGSLVTGD